MNSRIEVEKTKTTAVEQRKKKIKGAIYSCPSIYIHIPYLAVAAQSWKQTQQQAKWRWKRRRYEIIIHVELFI